MNITELLAAVRQLFSERPEYFHHQAWELQSVLFSLGYVNDLVDELRSFAAAGAQP